MFTGIVEGLGHVVSMAGARLEVRSDLAERDIEIGDSVAVNGTCLTSLTVAAVRPDGIDVALIPHTLATTTLGLRHRGDRLNVEVDVMAKYVARRIDLTLERRASGQGGGDAPTDAIERGRAAWASAGRAPGGL